MGDLLQRALPGDTLVVAIDPGKAQNRVWLSTDAAGLLVEPLTLLVLDRRFPRSVRLFAPSETTAARAQLGSRRFKTDDRDCTALTYLARQGHGRAVLSDEHAALLSAVRFRRGLLHERKAAQQRLHDQVNGLCPGLSAPVGHGRKLDLAGVAGQAFLDCLVDFAGRPAGARSLQARAAGRLTTRDAQYWAQRWKDCLPAPADAAVRVDRLARSVSRWRQLSADIVAVEADMARLLALTDGQILTSLTGVDSSKSYRSARSSILRGPVLPAH